MTTGNAGSEHSLPHHCKLVLKPLPFLLPLVHTEETESRVKGHQPPLISTEHGRKVAEHSLDFEEENGGLWYNHCY